MKIETTLKKGFRPFDFTISVETVDDLHTLWAILNVSSDVQIHARHDDADFIVPSFKEKASALFNAIDYKLTQELNDGKD